MVYVVLAVWIVQAAVGVSLFVGWLRHGRGSPLAVVWHVVPALAGLALWIVFVLADSLVAAWGAFLVLTVANVFGDRMMLRRQRRITGTTTFWRDYGTTLVSALRGRFPRRVVFHALFAGVVYFTCLGVCIGATVAAA
jgi:hypothetical protein